MITFDTITITPFSELLDAPSGLSVHRGGPVWPEWEKAGDVRHRRGDVAVDDEPHLSSESAPEFIDKAAYWCGPIVTHFGHQLADFSSRIPMYNRSDDTVLYCFSVRQNSGMTDISKTPRFFRDILKWHHIPEDRVLIVHKPVTLKTLYVEPQHEQLNTAPTEVLLDTLDHTMLTHQYQFPQKDGAYYISRAGMPKGKIAGEAYLELILGLNGVKVIRPETISLFEQLRIYASTKKLIFSEGSALHTLQLLGRSVGEVVVLNRRHKSSLAKSSLMPRVKSLRYETIGEPVTGLNPKGIEAGYFGICIPDETALKNALEKAGNTLKFWSSKAFRFQVQEDIKIWHHWLSDSNQIDPSAFKALIKPKIKAIRKLKYKV